MDREAIKRRAIEKVRKDTEAAGGLSFSAFYDTVIDIAEEVAKQVVEEAQQGKAKE